VTANLIEIKTPYGDPVAWAQVAMVSDIGDSHELNDDRCLVLTSRDLGEPTGQLLGDFMLCVLADGATGSTFANGNPAGWRASQLAQAAFVERFLASDEADVLDRLKDGLRAADRALIDSDEGRLSTTLTALFVAADGTAYAASIGDSVLLVLPPSRRLPGDRRLKKLGYEDTTAVGSGDTTLSYVDEAELIEQWWPHKEGGPLATSVSPDTYFVLMSDGIADNLAIDAIDHLIQRHALDAATVALPKYTRERRIQMQRRGGGSTTQLGLDNMSAIVVRYKPRVRLGGAVSPGPRLSNASLLSLAGTHGGPTPESGGHFGALLLSSNRDKDVPRFVRALIESEHRATMPARLRTALPSSERAQLSVLAIDEHAEISSVSAGWMELPSVLNVQLRERNVDAARESALQRFMYSPRLWASSLAALALFALVSTAFATGTVRPAPPPAPTAAPGQPTPTPDTRPRLSLGGFQLVAPVAPPTPTPTAAPAPAQQEPETTPPPASPPAQPEPVCRNPFGLLCSAPPPPPAPPPAVRRAPPPVVPGPSPVPEGAQTGPRPGSDLDRALQIASVANDQFNHSLQDNPDP